MQPCAALAVSNVCVCCRCHPWGAEANAGSGEAICTIGFFILADARISIIELIVSLLARLLVPQVQRQMLRLGQARFRFIPIHHLLLCSSTSDGQLNLGVVTRP